MLAVVAVVALTVWALGVGYGFFVDESTVRQTRLETRPHDYLI
jgi:hypothetical protein